MPLITVFALFFLLLPGLASAEIYKWVDEEGRVHYSNRSADGEEPAERAPSPSSGGEGWESVIERRQGSDDVSRRADRAINSLIVDRRQKKRERDRAYDALEKTRKEITRARRFEPARLPDLSSREREQLLDVRRIEMELSRIDAGIAKARAVKKMGREQATGQGENPYFQFGP